MLADINSVNRKEKETAGAATTKGDKLVKKRQTKALQSTRFFFLIETSWHQILGTFP